MKMSPLKIYKHLVTCMSVDFHAMQKARIWHHRVDSNWSSSHFKNGCDVIRPLCTSVSISMVPFCNLSHIFPWTDNKAYVSVMHKTKKNNCCVALKWDFWKSWVGRSKFFFFLNNFFKKHPKGPNLGAYSIIFLKTHPIWAKLGAFPTLLFFIFIFE